MKNKRKPFHSASLKDTVREIRHKPSRFFSIFAIVAIGVGFFVGVKATCPDMKQTADSYFIANQLMDMCIVSPLGLEEEDVQSLRSLAGVSAVMPSYSADALMEASGSNIVVKVLALPTISSDGNQTINTPVLLSGRLPQKSGECVVEENSPKSPVQFQLGDKISFYPEAGGEELSDKLQTDPYEIVGFVNSPQYISLERGSSSIGSGSIGCYIMILPEDFSYSVYTEIYVTFTQAADISAFSQAYDDLFVAFQNAVEDLGKTRAAIRFDHVKEEAQDKIDEAYIKIADAENERDQKLSEADKEIAAAKTEIAAAEDELAAAQTNFDKEINDAQEKLDEGYQQYYDSREEYTKEYAAFQKDKADAQMQIAAAENDLSQLNMQIELLQADIASRPQNDPNLPEMYTQLETMKQQYSGTQAALTEKKSELTAAEESFASANTQLNSTKAQLDKEQKNFDDAKADAQKEIDDARKKIEEAKMDLAEGEQNYKEGENDANQKISDAKEEVAEGEEDLKSLEVPEWIVLGRQDNPGYTGYQENADRLDGVATLFPLFFLLVAALVCLTTMMRMVEEQRSQIGAYKALGYSRFSVAFKYAVYAASASLLGSMIGVVVGSWLFPKVIYGAYDVMYSLPPIHTAVPWDVSIVSTVVFMLCTVLTAIVACNSELLSQPAALMRPKAPKPGKRIFIEKFRCIWSHMGFISKVTARNLLRYKIRFFMTVLGIAGCTALMVAGFGLKNSVSGIVTKQFDEINTYDLVLRLDENLKSADLGPLYADLSNDTRISQSLLIYQKAMDAKKADITVKISLFVPENTDKIEGVVSLRHRQDGTGITLSDEGAVISEKLSEILGVKAGDTLDVKEDDQIFSIPVAAIAENYVEHFIYITPQLYHEIFRKEVSFNTVLACVNDLSEQNRENLASDWLSKDGIMTVRLINDLTKSIKDSLKSLNTVVLVMIVSAGSLALVVLYNLTNINISERLREIATIKVLGFFNQEVSKFVFRENIILTLIGMLAGAPLGVLLHRLVVLSSEVDIVMFDRTIQWPVFLYSWLLTFLFTMLVQFAMHYRLKNISMVESLKSLD